MTHLLAATSGGDPAPLWAYLLIAAVVAIVHGGHRAVGVYERRRSGMLLERPTGTGAVLRKSAWRDGEVDGYRSVDFADDDLRVHECEAGWLVERWYPMAASTWLWFPRAESRVGERLVRGRWEWVLESPDHRAVFLDWRRGRRPGEDPPPVPQ